MNKYRIHILFLVALLFTVGCQKRSSQLTGFDREIYVPTDATGFTIMGDEDGSVLLTVTDPWQGADGEASRILFTADGKTPDGFDGIVVDGDARRIVAMSSTYIAMLDCLDATDRVAGVSGIDFISNDKIQARRDEIVDVGNEANVDFERLVSLAPDLVLVYGVNGPSAMEPKLRQLGIPFIYIGDYMEQSPLGKAEWMVAIGQMVGKRDEAIAYYAGVKERYEAMRERAAGFAGKPKVMINTPYNDSWFMPSVGNYSVRLIEDAGGEYIYSENRSNSSVPIDIEKAYLLASDADVWINPGRVDDLADIKRLLPKFAGLRAFSDRLIYNNDRRSTPGGGNDFYESGAVNPDLVLRDLISIFHPEAASDSLTYYRRLQ